LPQVWNGPLEGQAQIQQGLAAYQASGAELWRPSFLALLAHAYRKGGQIEAGLSVLTEALETVSKTDERWYEADLHRLKGELTLQQKSTDPRAESRDQEAEGYFLQAISVARKQRAKSLELRATMSLARLWQHQSKWKEARQTLSEIYNWFTEGFDTRDLQEAKALLATLRE
jgi:predicted ATPase